MARHLIINGRFLGGRRTAVNAVAGDLTRALAEQDTGWQISLAVPKELEKHAEAYGFPLRVIGRGGGAAWDQLYFARLRRSGVLAGFFNTVPLAGLGHVTLLHDAHVFATPESYPAGVRQWRRLMSRRAGAAGNHLLTVSDHARRSLLGFGIGAADRIGVVPNGVHLSGVRDEAILDRFGLRSDPYFAAISSVLPHKNLRVLLDAFASPALSGRTLVLVGEAQRAEYALAGLPVPDGVRFVGRISDAERRALFRSATAVCVPSTQEGFGLPVLEAMAEGTPVVTSDHGALPEVAGAAGLIAGAHVSEDWVTACLRLSDPASSLRGELSRRASARAARFTWAASAEALMRLLDRWYPEGSRR